jgi:large subunit ribosomal protein L27
MAHKKAGGSSRNGRDSAGRRLGVKRFGGQSVQSAARSSSVNAAPNSTRVNNVGLGRDHTLFALCQGKVAFATKRDGRTYVSIAPIAWPRRNRRERKTSRIA